MLQHDTHRTHHTHATNYWVNTDWEKKYKAGLSSASGASDALKAEVAQLTDKLQKEGDRAREADAKAKQLGDEVARLDEDLEDLRLAHAKLEKEKKLLQVDKEELEEDVRALEDKLKLAATNKAATSDDVAKQHEAQVKALAAKFEKEDRKSVV